MKILKKRIGLDNVERIGIFSRDILENLSNRERFFFRSRLLVYFSFVGSEVFIDIFYSVFSKRFLFVFNTLFIFFSSSMVEFSNGLFIFL